MTNPAQKTKDQLCAEIPEWKRQQVASHITREGRCHVWQGSKSHGPCNSYGRFKNAGKSFLAHRAQLIWAAGLPPTIYSVACHTCANKLCINPGHLRWGTHAENANDYAKHQKNGNRPLQRKEALLHRLAQVYQTATKR